MHACTIIARNYLPYARVLAESFVRHHPGSRFTVLILDGSDDLEESFEIVTPYEIGIEREELHRMAMIYDLKELATAVKPWLLRTLLARGEGAAVYLDPDIEIYQPLEDIEALALEHSIVLTPHTTEPLPDDGCLPDEEMIMQAGIYNLGFIAVGPGAGEFLDWWSERLSRKCIVAPDEALFVDQRWVDFVPALFENYILADHGCNVAYWNLHARRLIQKGDQYEVDGVPLRFFHFSGYKPDTPNVLTHHAGTRPRVLLSQCPDLARLCKAYGQRVLAHGYGQKQGSAYEFDRLPGGIEIDSRMRRLYRDELLASAKSGKDEPPDPFDPASVAGFLDWLREPMASGSRGAVSRYAYAVYLERPDLQDAFRRVPGRDAHRFVEWIYKHGQPEMGFSKLLLPAGSGSARALSIGRGATIRAGAGIERRLRSLALSHPILARGRPIWRALKRAHLVPGGRGLGGRLADSHELSIDVAEEPSAGVNLVGYLNAELGVGEVARKLMSGLEKAGIEFATTTYERTVSRKEHRVEGRRAQEAPFDMNIICVNADQLPIFRADAGRRLFERRHTVGVWFWEVASFPRSLGSAFKLVDEVWVATRFVRDAVAAATLKPVRVVPLPLEVPPAEPLSRDLLGLPDRFMFLFSFDFLSVFERKNPLGLIDAFTRAFSDDEGPILVLKCINGDHDLESLERLRMAAAQRADVYVLDGYVSPEMNNSLMAGCDCYVSLHRSEGLGLTMAEAMAYGKPVIATDYSGNVDFMNEGNSIPIPFEIVSIPKGCDPYPVGTDWADPDLDAAASAMRRVYDDPEAARELGEAARKDIADRFSLDRTAAFLRERFEVRHDEDHVRSLATGTDEALEEVARKLERGGPGGDLVRAKRRRPGVRTSRAFLHKLLWPYLESQQELEVAVADAISHLRREMQDTTLELSDSLRKLESALSDLAGAVDELRSQLPTPRD